EAVILKAMSHHIWPTNPGRGADWANEAIAQYDVAIALCKADQELDPENVRILTDLAWNHCGKTSCIQQLLQTQSAATDDSPPAMAVDRIVGAARSLPPLELVAFNRALERAFHLKQTEERSGAEPYATAISKAASRLATSLLRNLQEDEAEVVLEEW